MNSRRALTIAVFSAVLVAAIAGSLVFADEFDQAMKLTFGQSIAIPGQVLPSGTYWFVLAGHGSDPNTMQVFDEDRKNVLATLHTGNVQTVKPSGRIILTLADRSPHQPQALINIVYPGRAEGHQFELVYSDQERKQLSEFPKVTMKVGENGAMEKVTSGQ